MRADWAAVYEHDGVFPRAESERLAYRDALVEFLSRRHPAIVAEFESAIFLQALH